MLNITGNSNGDEQWCRMIFYIYVSDFVQISNCQFPGESRFAESPSVFSSSCFKREPLWMWHGFYGLDALSVLRLTVSEHLKNLRYLSVTILEIPACLCHSSFSKDWCTIFSEDGAMQREVEVPEETTSTLDHFIFHWNQSLKLWTKSPV